ncbi:UDP-N-acetylmuramate dehydrogenase [Idiomarina fontislapidosi]|nr:UDP-N-acetylmuramate dehydrogenase [Idiomarina fontislapidosi]
MRTIDDARKVSGFDKFLILGDGTNTIFIDDYDGVIVKSCISGVDCQAQDEGWYIRVGAQENWHRFVTWTLNENIRGLENLVLIPGSVGAAPVQNIGAYGVEVSQYIKTVEAVHLATGQQHTLTNHQCDFSYRDSIFKRQPGAWLITHVNFFIPKSWQPNLSYPALAELNTETSVTAQSIADKVIAIRSSKLPDPARLPNAGSFFKNPLVSVEHYQQLIGSFPDLIAFKQNTGYKLAAGWLIEHLGLKGACCGDCCVHDKQALVLVNQGHATGGDVLALCRLIQQRVEHAFGVMLEPEVRMVGHGGLIHDVSHYPG